MPKIIFVKDNRVIAAQFRDSLCALGTNYYVYGKGNYYKETIK